MKKIIFLILALILVACTPQVTVTSEVTVTLTPPPTETPTPTSTAEPSFYAEAQEFFGGGFTVTSDGKVIDKATNTEIEYFTVVPFNEKTMIDRKSRSEPASTWALEINYLFENKENFKIYRTQYDLTIEGGIISTFGMDYVDGEIVRDGLEFAGRSEGSTVEIEEVHSPEEIMQMIINNSSTNPKHRINSTQTALDLTVNIPHQVINREVYFTYEGMLEKRSNTNYFYNNFIPVMNDDGTWSAVETTLFVIQPGFKQQDRAFVTWIGVDGKQVIVIMEGKYVGSIGFFNKYWQTHSFDEPFNP